MVLNKCSILCFCFIFYFGFLSAQDQQRFLYVLSRFDHEITSYELSNPNASKTVLGKNKQALVNPYAFTYDATTDELVWVDATSKTIRKGKPDNNNSQQKDLGLNSVPVDIKVDAINGHLYWLDHQQKRIMRSDLLGENPVVVTADSMSRPTAIAISPAHDRLFWADMDLKKIFASSLDGANIREIFSDKKSYAVRLTVDPANKQLYWSDDVANEIHVMDFSGNTQRLLYKGGDEEAPFGLFFDTQEQYLYWSDYALGQVRRIKKDGTGQELVVSDIKEPMDLLILDRDKKSEGRTDETIVNSKLEISELDIFPNPASGNINISISGSIHEEGKVLIYDQFGQLVRTTPLPSNHFLFDTTGLSGGWYMCRIESNGKQLQKQFLLIR